MSRISKMSIVLRKSLKFRILGFVVGTFTLLSIGFTLYIVGQFGTLAILNAYHEGQLLSDTLESVIANYARNNDEKSIQKFIDRLVETRDVNDIEINVIKKISPSSSEIVASNNPDNIEEADIEEHKALLDSIVSGKPQIEIERIDYHLDPDDDPGTMNDPNHPDYYLSPGHRIISITTPLVYNDEGWGSINVELSLRYLDEKQQVVYTVVGITLVAGLILFAVVLVLFLNYKLFNPIWELANSIYRFGIGQLSKSEPSDRMDEIGFLNNEFFSMVDRITAAEEKNLQYRDHLEELVDERTSELMLTQEATILSMASLAETRDNETGGHLKRTQEYMKAVAKELQKRSLYSSELNETAIDLMCKSAPLHDIGKVGIPDEILLKPGKLTNEEFEIMKNHTTLGKEAILAAEMKLGSNSFLRYAREIAHTHQEKWDGNGYPQGLSGEEIPLSGRLMAIADVYDALISKRVYKPPFSHKKAMRIITEGRGNHFDPEIVDAFIAIEKKIKDIASNLADSTEERDALLSEEN